MRDVQRGRNVAMGASGWDEDSWDRGRAQRRSRSGDDGGDGRSSRSADRGSSRARYEGDPRGSSGNWERRGSSRDGSSRDDRGGTPRPNGGRSRSGYEEDRYERGGSPGRSSRDPRADYDARVQDRSRSSRGTRDETWDAPSRGRSGMGAPGASGARNRAPARGVWDDDERRPRRQDVGDLRGARGASTRDPRYAGRGLARDADDDEKESGFTAGKGLLTVFLVLLLSAGAAFAYFKVSTPHVPADLIAPTAGPTQTTAVTPSTSPAASVTATTK